MTPFDFALTLPLALPVLGAALVVVLRRRRAVLGILSVATMVATLAAGVWCAVVQPGASWAWGPTIEVGLAVTGLGRVMVLLIPLIAIPVVAYTAAATRNEAGAARLLAILLAFVAAMELLVMSADLLILLMAWELVSACSWGLISHEWADPERPRAARDSFLATRAGDLGLYLAAAATFTSTGSFRFDLLATMHGPALHIAAAGLLLAAAAKSAQLPFSPWLFRAMRGPTGVSALLHSATLVAAGAYALARLAPLLASASWLDPAITGLGLTTALAGGIVAALQMDLKKALAASTSAQYGFMFVAIGAGAPAAAGLHLITHAAFKALLFLGAGIAMQAVGTLDLRQMQLGRELPRVAGLFAVGALALGAVPPLGGAYTKEAIVGAASRASIWLASGTIIAGFLGAFYSARLMLLAFGPPRTGRTTGRLPEIRDVSAPPSAELLSMAILALVTIALGVLWLPGAGDWAASLMDGGLIDGTRWSAPVSLAFTAGAAALCWALWRRGQLYTLALRESVRASLADWLGLPRATRVLVIQPALALARTLARVDDRVIDAGLRGAVAGARALSRLLGWWGERGLDGIVTLLASFTSTTARASRSIDDRGLDAAVEGFGRGVEAGGARARALQSGLVHQYYVLTAAGVLLLVAATAVATFARR